MYSERSYKLPVKVSEVEHFAGAGVKTTIHNSSMQCVSLCTYDPLSDCCQTGRYVVNIATLPHRFPLYPYIHALKICKMRTMRNTATKTPILIILYVLFS